jgi:hypothetical protein
MTDFLHDPGTSGFIATPFALFNASDTGLNALTNGSVVTSANGGTSGVFSQTNFANAQLCEIWFNIVTAGWTPTAGGCIAGWFLMSTDGGSTFEAMVASPSSTAPAVARSPDFIIPFEPAALSAGIVKFAQGPVPVPWTSCKVTVQNMTGATLGAGAHTIYAGPVADKY